MADAFRYQGPGLRDVDDPTTFWKRTVEISGEKA